MEKYNQQLLSEKLAAEQVSPELAQEENSSLMLERVPKSVGEDVKRVDAVQDRRKAKKESFPTWMMFLLVSIFGIVMALPLLQL